MGFISDLGKTWGDYTLRIMQPVVDAIHESVEKVMWKNEKLKAIDLELVTKTIKPEMMRSKEMQEFVVELHKKLRSSPQSLTDWFYESFGKMLGFVYDSYVGLVIPEEPFNFENAKEQGGRVLTLALDVTVLIGMLDIVACAVSATFLRNLVHIGRLFMGTFGLDRLLSVTLGPPAEGTWLPSLRQGYNEMGQLQIPPIQDVIRFTVREVYDPVRRAELLSVPTPKEAYPTARKHGFSDKVMDDYWAAHWILPSINELNTMIHRRVIDAEKWKRYVTLNDYEPTMIDNYNKIIYSPYYRVDARRMHDMNVLDDAALTSTYMDMGYDKEHAENLTIWTKVYNSMTSIRERYSKGYLNEEEVTKEITATGLPVKKVTELVQRIVKEEKPARVEKERELTKAEIIRGIKFGKLDSSEGKELLTGMGYTEDEADFLIETGTATTEKAPIERDITRADVIRSMNRGLISKDESIKMLKDMYYDEWEAQFIVDAYYEPMPTAEEAARNAKALTKAEIISGYKKNVITPDQTVAALMDLGYEEWEASYLVVINTKEPVSSPLTYGDYQNMVQKWRKSQGLKSEVLTPEALILERQYIKARQELENAKAAHRPETEIAELALKLQGIEKAYREAIKRVKETKSQ